MPCFLSTGSCGSVSVDLSSGEVSKERATASSSPSTRSRMPSPDGHVEDALGVSLDPLIGHALQLLQVGEVAVDQGAVGVLVEGLSDDLPGEVD